ncbi:hypothetical protein [Photobacterium leiognathi]|uniref:hypothetical protein n=1 Tax=Photobacterium leiognathi TaxID=553611 RepID=UPI00273A0BBF|nr:hypothetical protein [Photobacterium leiognathi]
MQQVHGLEGNKEFLEEIYLKRNVSDGFDLIYYLSFLISERNEDGCYIGDFYYRMKKIFDDIRDKDFSNYLNSIIGYVVFNKKYLPFDYIRNFSSITFN